MIYNRSSRKDENNLMALSRTMQNPVIYNGEVLFKKYHEMGRAGSYKKLGRWAMENGMVNPNTGRISWMGPIFSMWRWAMRHPHEAFPYWKKWAEQFESELLASGYEPTYENFLREIQRKAKLKGVITHNGYKKWCEENGLEP